MDKHVPTLCLNMIVKNESLIIKRMLDSVIDIIDSYCICDTGSTDNTISVIKNYFIDKNIKGKIINKEFVNFEYNRNFSLEQCEGMSDYILLMDADMTLVNNGFDKKTLSAHDFYYIIQEKKNMRYGNIRIIKNNELGKYNGVTHEFIEIKNLASYKTLSKNTLYINDLDDGGCKNDKYERDIKLLSTALIDDPNNSRYMFYLANCYYDTKQYKLCIDTYLKRIVMGGWVQEIWFSYYMIGVSYMILNECDKSIFYHLEGYNCFPKRIENLFEIIKYYVKNEKYNVAKLYYDIAENILDNLTEQETNTYLFFMNPIYDTKLYDSCIPFAYKTSEKYPFKDVNKIINKQNDIFAHTFYSNIDHYIYELECINDLNITKLQDTPKNYLIIKLYPTINYSLIDNNIIELGEQMPKIFEYIRKSTNGYIYNDNVYFLFSTKLIINDKKSVEHNIIAIFNKDMKLIKYTVPFKIKNVILNQHHGLIVTKDEIVLLYYDNIIKINNLVFQNMLITY